MQHPTHQCTKRYCSVESVEFSCLAEDIVLYEQCHSRAVGFMRSLQPPWIEATAEKTSTSVFGDWRISTHADPTSTHRAISRTALLYGKVYMWVGMARALADSSDFGPLGEQSSQKWEILCLGRRWTAVQNVTPLALSSTEKSVTVQANTQSVTDISTPASEQWRKKRVNSMHSVHWCDVVHTLCRYVTSHAGRLNLSSFRGR